MALAINLKFTEMKLLSKVNRFYFKYGFLAFLLTGVVISELISVLIKDEIDQQLKLEANEIAWRIGNKEFYQATYPSSGIEAMAENASLGEIYKDTVIYDPIQKEPVPFREYSMTLRLDGKNYRISTRRMLMELDDFLTIFTGLISAILLFVFLGLFIFTKRFNSRIFRTFNSNLENLKVYSFNPPVKLTLLPTGIAEFDELNRVLSRMSDRLEKDYIDSKEFSANVAHEIQTPLAIIRSKCENLFSKPDLNDETVTALRDIYLSTDKLSGTIKALLLLAKIDNGQFNDKSLVSFNELLENWVDSLRDIIVDRSLLVSISNTNNCTFLMDRRLADLLAQNVFVNAIKHSSRGEKIEIVLSKNQFQISNHGAKPLRHPQKIFERFYKESRNKESTGIGLAIVKKIADFYGISITYTFKDFRHVFTFQLPSC